MSITGVGIGTNFTPALGLPQAHIRRMESRSAQQREAVVRQFTANLPGNGDDGVSRKGEIPAILRNLQKVSLVFNKKLEFVVDHRSNEVIVKVIDTETDKVIKVLPPEELQRLNDKLKETIGFLFDERV